MTTLWQAAKTALVPEPVRRALAGWYERRRQARIAELLGLRRQLHGLQ